MKSSLLLVTALFLPDVFAAAVPSKPHLAVKRFPHADSAQDASSVSDGTLAYFGKVAAGGDKDLKHRELPEHKKLLPGRAGPLIGGPSTTPTSTSTPFSTTSLASADGYLPSDPAQSFHNSLVGSHPFYGHGPAIATPSPTPSSYIGMYDTNITFAVPAAGTVPPIANATATIYAAPTADCPPQPVPEAIDSHGNFLPTDQQPGYNGSVSTNGTVPGNCSAPTAPTPQDQVIIEGHMEGNTEVVEIDIIPLPDNSTLNTFYGAGFTPSGTPTSTYLDSAASTTNGLGASMSTGTSQLVPDAGNPGFTGPKVRDLRAV